MRAGLLTAGAIFAALIVLGLVLRAFGVESSPDRAWRDGLDPSAQLACEEYAGYLDAERKGILTPSESRARVQKVHDKARVSESPGVASSSTALLAAFSSGTGDAGGAASNMIDACHMRQQ